MSQANITVHYDRLDITQIVMSATWSGHSEKPHRQLDLSIINTTDGRTQRVKFEKGKPIKFFNNGVLLFWGVVFATEIDQKGYMKIIAYDENVYLLKNMHTQSFKEQTAGAIVKSLCNDYGIPIGNIADTGYVIPRLIIREKSLYDTIVMALSITRNQMGRRFFLSNTNGKLNLQPYTINQSEYLIEVGRNILTASYSQSIEDTKTRVKVIGGKNGAFTATQKSPELEKMFGIMQIIERVDESATKSQVTQRAVQLLKERAVINDQATVEVLGIPDVVTGRAVYVREPMTGIIGGYYVSSDVHTFENGVHKMQIEVTHTYELPKLEVSKEELGL